MDKWVSGKGAFNNINTVQKMKKSLVRLALLKTFFRIYTTRIKFWIPPDDPSLAGIEECLKSCWQTVTRHRVLDRIQKIGGKFGTSHKIWMHNVGQEILEKSWHYIHAAQCSQKSTIKNIPQRLTSTIFEVFFLTQSITIYSTIFKNTFIFAALISWSRTE